jgi:ABC-type transport system substrate-binding protein
MDLYLFGLKTEAALELQDEERVQLIDAPATSLSLLLNPAPAPEGELNPFSIPEVRQAMQYLINREFITRDIYQGFGQPMVTHVGPSDPDFLTIYDIDRGSGIVYDPELGRELIAEAMTAAGAELVDGKWHYNGELIRLRFIARVEDERREIGNLVAAELDEAGFEVTMDPKTFAAAVQTVYSSDPQTLEWHLYTEGWGRSAPQRYDVGAVNSFNGDRISCVFFTNRSSGCSPAAQPLSPLTNTAGSPANSRNVSVAGSNLSESALNWSRPTRQLRSLFCAPVNIARWSSSMGGEGGVVAGFQLSLSLQTPPAA